MAGLADLVPEALPALTGAGATATVTEGTTWTFPNLESFEDANGDPIDMTGGGWTAVCKVWDEKTGLDVVTIPVTRGVGVLTLSIAKASTAGLSNNIRGGRRCRWGLYVDDGTTRVQVFGPENSVLTILNEEGTT